MKLNKKIKNKIDKYFDSVTPDELYKRAIELKKD